MRIFFILLAFCTVLNSAQAQVSPIKEWSILVFMNGNNSLDEETVTDLNEMEKVGSDKNVNVVVQWAQKSANKTVRLRIEQDSYPDLVTSPALEVLPRIDMGDYKNFVDFVKWSVQHYPAKRYVVVLWGHGTGWHELPKKDQKIIADVSPDDFTKNKITTAQLGFAMQEIAQAIGRPIDILGNDSCSMASLEVVTEIKDSARYVIGSQELEDDNGWQYDGFLSKLVKQPTMSALELSKLIADTYTDAYPDGGSMGGTTVSVADTSQIPELLKSIGILSNALMSLKEEDLYEVWSAADVTQRFWYDVDYKDAGQFFINLKIALGKGEDEEKNMFYLNLLNKIVADYTRALPYVVNSKKYANATGLTIWVPQFNLIYDRFVSEYEKLQFSKITSWNFAAKAMLRPNHGPYRVQQIPRN